MKLNRKAVTTAVVAALLAPSVGLAGIPPLKAKAAKGPNIQRKKAGTTHLVNLHAQNTRLSANLGRTRGAADLIQNQEIFLNTAVARQLKLTQDIERLQNEYQVAFGNFQRVPTLNNKGRYDILKERLSNKVQELNALNENIVNSYELLKIGGVEEDLLPQEIQLNKAAQKGDLEAVKKLVEAGADPRPAVSMALEYPVVTEYLLVRATAHHFSYRADLSHAIRMNYADTVEVFYHVLSPAKEEVLQWMQEAVGYHQFDIAKLLMKLSKTKPTEEMTVAYIRSNDRAALSFLVTEGKVNLNKLMKNGSTLMHEACRMNPLLLPFLVKLGGDVNTINAQGNTPLHLAVFKPEAIAQLRKLNAKTQIKNNQNLTPSQYGITLLMDMAAERDPQFFDQIKDFSFHTYLLQRFPKEMNSLMEFEDVLEKVENDLVKEIISPSHPESQPAALEASGEELPVDPVLQDAEPLHTINPNELPVVEP